MNKRILAFVVSFGLMSAGMLMYEILAQKTIEGDETLTIPEGAFEYVYVEIVMPEGGPVSGTYECTSGGEIMVMVLDGGQFDRFSAGEDYGSRFAGSGTSGSFSIERVDMERCYIVLFHGAGTGDAQQARVTYNVDSLDSARALVGAVMLAIGIAAMIGFAALEMKKRIAATPPPKYIDVTFFDENK